MFETLEFWHWWLAAAVLAILELTAAGAFFFLWIASAAALTGVAAWMAPPMSWQFQLFVFALLSVASVVLWHRYRPRPAASDQPALNRRAHQYIGRRFTLDKPIENGVGKLIVSDTTWRIVGAELPAGTQVEVTRVEGTSLHVERVS